MGSEAGPPSDPQSSLALQCDVSTIYAIANQKGSVSGRRRRRSNVAACIAEAGYRHGARRRRPAGGTRPSAWGIARHEGAGACTRWLTGEGGARAEALTDSSVPGLQVAGRPGAGPWPARTSSCHVSRLSSSACGSAWQGRLREQFEYILLDCPPSLGPLTVSARWWRQRPRDRAGGRRKYFALGGTGWFGWTRFALVTARA